MANNQARKQELLAKIANGTTDKQVYDELMQLNQQEEQAQQARLTTIEDVKRLIRENAIQLDEIRSVFGAGSRAPAGRRLAKRTTRRGGDILIANVKTASGKGAASNYHRGQKIPQYVPKAFKELYQANHNSFDSALEAHFTEAGKAYFATAEGKAELGAWMKFVMTRPVNPRQS